MNDWPADPELDIELRRLVNAELAAAAESGTSRRRQSRGSNSRAFASLGLLAVVVIVASLVLRAQSNPGLQAPPGRRPSRPPRRPAARVLRPQSGPPPRRPPGRRGIRLRPDLQDGLLVTEAWPSRAGREGSHHRRVRGVDTPGRQFGGAVRPQDLQVQPHRFDDGKPRRLRVGHPARGRTRPDRRGQRGRTWPERARGRAVRPGDRDLQANRLHDGDFELSRVRHSCRTGASCSPVAARENLARTGERPSCTTRGPGPSAARAR